MDELVRRATNSIDQLLESIAAWDTGLLKSQLISTRNLLNELLISGSPKNDLWTRLFSQQLERLMTHYDFLPPDFWIQLHDDILYILGKYNREGNKKDSWIRFLARMKFESELEQRQLKFSQIYGERKSLHKLFNENQEIIKAYLHKCISLHSKVKIQGLIQNINALLRRDYMISDDLIIKKCQKNLEEKLKDIEIPFDCSNRSLNDVSFRLSTTIDDNLNVFVPSIEPFQVDKNSSQTEILNAIKYVRWFVILGDPGSAKTTLLRWIMHILAEAAYCGHKELNLTEKFGYIDWNSSRNECYIPVRIPILIRIGEFAEWLMQHQSKTLIDYIGEHTWFNERYLPDDNQGNVLKDFIYHGHAFILLDGLDEIPDVRQRSNIIEHVHRFIDEYVRTPNLISPFDDSTFTVRLPLDSNDIKLFGIPPAHESGGNQIIVTSRLMGYHLYPLHGHSIAHSSLSLINHEKAEEFVNNWMCQVEKVVLEIFFDEDIKPDKESMRILTEKRSNIIKKIFEHSPHLLMSNPLLLSLICMLIFQTSDEFNPKTRIEIYDRVVQTVLHSYTNQQSNISKTNLIHFLIDLASYLHLQSPTGLIDAFDMKMLCCLCLQQQGFSNNKFELRQYVDKLISSLNFNIGIIVDRSLLVFGFIHLSFQEYFVAQSFLRGSSIDEIIKRILTFLLHPRFRESIFLSLSWISWKWSLDDYDQFCYQLITSNKSNSIPYGILLFFESFNHLQKLPSNSILYTALNFLLDHSINIITDTYLSLNLFQLNNDLLIEWINLCYKNDQNFLKFCQCLLNKYSSLNNEFDVFEKGSLPRVIRQQFEFIHNMNTSNSFIIDQILRKTVPSNIDDFFLHSFRHDIHPLILSVIIAVCYGISITDDEDERILEISFSTHEMYRQSSILPAIIQYLENDRESHSIKIQNLIKYYENILENCSLTDISLNIVDTFIALICLQSVSQISIYEKYKKYSALPIALDRLKWTWFYLRKSYNNHIYSLDDEVFQSLSVSENDSFTKIYFSQCTTFASLCAFIWDKMTIDNQRNFYNNNENSFKCINFYDMTEILYSFDEFQDKPSLLLCFIPQSLQELYYNMIRNDTDSLPLIVLLSDCLIYLENSKENNWNFYLALVFLQPIFKNYNMENSIILIFWKKISNDNDREIFLKIMKDHIKFDQPDDWQVLINVERQRICQAENTKETNQRDLQFFSASICLSRLYHNQTNHVNLSSIKQEQINFAIKNLSNPILRIIAQSMILNLKNPWIFDEEKKYQFEIDMIDSLQTLLPNLSLLKSTLLFIRSYEICQMFPDTFQHMTNIIGEKLNNSSRIEDREIAFIALRQLNNSNLSYYLSQSIKQMNNLSNVLHLNSTIFHQYFIKKTSFDSKTNVLLSILYLIELIFDAQILRIYTNNDYKTNQDKVLLWKDLKCEKRMTFQIATWLTNYFEVLNKEDLYQIIRDVSECIEIERKSLPLIQTWLDYRLDKELKLFAQYAALQMIIHDSNNSEKIITIINEIFDIDCEFRLKSILEYLIELSSINLTILRLILIQLNQHIHYSLPLSIRISRKELFELVLNSELERIISNQQRKSFLSIFLGCSNDLYDYLYEFIEINNDLHHTIKEEYFSMIIKWIIKHFNKTNYQKHIFTYSFSFLHNQQYSRIQKAILYSFNLRFRNNLGEDIFIYDEFIIHLEKLICSYRKYQEDVRSICLLTYGNYLLTINDNNIKKNISNELKQSFMTLFQNSSSLNLSIRAGFCLIFIEQSTISLDTISNWFENKWTITTEKKYSILLQPSLYRYKHFYSESINQVIKYIEINFEKLIDRFILEFYNDLNSKRCTNYNLFGSTPYFIYIASNLSTENIDRMVDAIRKSSFGEDNFKNELYYYFCYTNNKAVSGLLIKCYATFGVLTVQLINMLKWTNDWDWDYDESSKYLKNIRNVSDRTVTDQLFELLNLMAFQTYPIRFSSLLKLIIQLARNHIISVLEIQQRLSLILEYNNIQLINKKHIVNTLLNLTFLRNELSLKSTIDLVTENIIDKHFQNVEKKLPLFIRNNQFFTSFRKNVE